jgi:hypothetical protein
MPDLDTLAEHMSRIVCAELPGMLGEAFSAAVRETAGVPGLSPDLLALLLTRKLIRDLPVAMAQIVVRA